MSTGWHDYFENILDSIEYDKNVWYTTYLKYDFEFRKKEVLAFFNVGLLKYYLYLSSINTGQLLIRIY